MAGVGLFAYLRRKVVASFFRLVLIPYIFFSMRRDRLVAESTYQPSVQTIHIPSRDKNRTIKAHLYSPSSSSTSSSGSQKPVLVNWHGSGFIIPLHGIDVLYCARLAKEAGIYVLDADYRKAPEYPYPAAVHDAEDALKWVATQSDRLDASRVAVSGFSAGGNLAVVAASALRKDLKEMGVDIKTLAAIYPITDIALAPEQKKVPHPIRPISAPVANLFNNCYVPDEATRKDPRVSPSLGDLSTFAETVVMVTCDGDILAPEADALAQKLDDGTRKVVHISLKEVPHGFDRGIKEGSKEWNRREEAYGAVVKALKESLGS